MNLATLWLNSHPDEKTKALSVLNMDMVGEDPDKTGGVMRIEKTPDPSAKYNYTLDTLPWETDSYYDETFADPDGQFIRLPDSHTLWGARSYKGMFQEGFFLNDLYMYAAQGVINYHDSDFRVDVCPYEGGSDHSRFLAQNVPALLTWHFTDYTYHSSVDTLNMSSAREMENVSITTMATALMIANATDGNEALNDVIVSLTLPENISLGGGSLSNYVGSMAAKSMQNITFSVLPAAGFTGTVADITVNMTGTGAISGKAVSSTTAISVPISQPDRFEVGQLQLSSESIMVGETGSVTLSYVNKGKNAIGNLEARLTGTNLGGENYQYLGNLNAGTEGSVDFDITPDAAGNISGVITLNYEDASGNPRTISKDFTATAEEMNYDDYMPDSDSNMDEPQQTGMPVWGWVLIVVCVGVVVAVIVVVVLRKRKKAKALAALDEDSDEDI